MGETTGPVRTGDSTDEIRRNIAVTQREMSHTIDEIQYRLSPAHLKQQATESVRRAGLRTSRGIVDRVRENPLGAAMVGVGLWLMMRDSDHHNHDYNYEIEFEPEFRGALRTDGRNYQTGWSDESRGLDLKDRMGEAVGDAKEQVSDVAEDLRERAGEVADSARQRARQLQYRTRYQARHLTAQSRDLMMDNPLVAGVAAVALGAIVGSMLPETRRENEWFGEASDKVGRRVGEVAREGLDHAKDIAGAAASAATETARRETKAAGQEMKETLRDGDELGR